MARIGKRHRLVLYTYILDRLWRKTLRIGLILLALEAALVWLPSVLPIVALPPASDLTLLLIGCLGTYAILLSFFLVSLRKLAYVQPYDSYVRLVTPFLRLNISYRRFVHASSAEMGRLFSVEDLKGWKRDFLHPLAGETAIVLELNSWPLPRRVLKLFLSPFFFPDRTATRIALLVPDWMKFSTELESLRSTWIDSLLRPDRAPQSDLFASLSDNP